MLTWQKMNFRHNVLVYLPIAVAGALMGILAAYSIAMDWYQKILVYIFGGAILLTGFIVSEKMKSYREGKR